MNIQDINKKIEKDVLVRREIRKKIAELEKQELELTRDISKYSYELRKYNTVRNSIRKNYNGNNHIIKCNIHGIESYLLSFFAENGKVNFCIAMMYTDRGFVFSIMNDRPKFTDGVSIPMFKIAKECHKNIMDVFCSDDTMAVKNYKLSEYIRPLLLEINKNERK